jgi:hypothetical protein
MEKYIKRSEEFHKENVNQRFKVKTYCRKSLVRWMDPIIPRERHNIRRFHDRHISQFVTV